jgi:hypothetical protein
MNLCCTACGAEATSKDGSIARKCCHAEAPVTAEMTATVFGESSVANGQNCRTGAVQLLAGLLAGAVRLLKGTKVATRANE